MRTTMKITTLVLLILFAALDNAKAHDEYSRVITRDYSVNPGAQLNISNIYGRIHCNNWNKPMISVEVTLRVEASSEQAAQKLMDRIIITMSGSPTLVDLKTTLDKEGYSGRSKITIDYELNIPVNINLDLTNKFGDVYINEISGKGKINLGYGNIEVNKLGNSDNVLDLKFSKGNFKSIQGAVVLLKYSELDIDYAGSIRLDSKYSDLSANKIISLNGTFEGGKLEIENSSAVESKSKFADMSFSRIEKNLNIDIQYGNFHVEEMPADFAGINISNKYGDVSIGLPENASYSLDAALKFCDLEFPEERASFSLKSTDNTTKAYKAVIGKESNPTAKINVRSEFGNVTLEK